MPGRHCLWRVELYGISFFYFSSLERRIGTKGELTPELKRRRAAAEGTMAVRCRLLSGQDFVIPTQSINIRLCRGKMGRGVLSTSQCQGQSDQAMTCGVHMRNGGLSSLCARPTVPGWEGSEISWYIPGLLGCLWTSANCSWAWSVCLCFRRCASCE